MNVLLLKLGRIGRVVRDMPLLYTLLLVVLMFFAACVLWRQLSRDPNGYFITILFAGILLTYHHRRKDLLFIKSLYQCTYLICLLEYAAISIPFLVLIVISGNMKLIPIALACVLAIPLYPRFNQINLKLIPYNRVFPNSYEWISGCRKSTVYILVFYIISMILLLKTHMALFAYFFILLQCLSFYREGESITLLCLPEKTAVSYLRNKIILANKNFHMLSLPFYIAFIVTHPLLWWWLFIFSGIVVSLSFSFSISLKYAKYTPNTNYIGNDVILTLGVLAAITPLFPLVILLTWRYFKSARTNLGQYLDAYNS